MFRCQVFVLRFDIRSNRVNSKKFYSPWRGIYQVIERTNPLTYKVCKKGGRIRIVHINRLKFYDPVNSPEDKDVHLSNEEDLGTQNEEQTEDTTDRPTIPSPNDVPEGRVTRSRTNALPPPNPQICSDDSTPKSQHHTPRT